jgi:DNA-binding NtrC family response regulator
VRQLEHFIERVLVLSDTHAISRAQIARELEGDGRPTASAIASLDDQRRDVERSALQRALAQAGDNRTRAARILGVSRRTFYNKLKEHGIE